MYFLMQCYNTPLTYQQRMSYNEYEVLFFIIINNTSIWITSISRFKLLSYHSADKIDVKCKFYNIMEKLSEAQIKTRTFLISPTDK